MQPLTSVRSAPLLPLLLLPLIAVSGSTLGPKAGSVSPLTSQQRNINTFMRSASAVVWDVDGTLVESTTLGFVATNEVLKLRGFPEISVEQYKIGCRYTTPDRFNHHVGEEPGTAIGTQLGQDFDDMYVKRVSKETAGLFDGMERLLRSLALSGHPQGALSNACGDYVRAVLAANNLDEVPGQRIGLFGVAYGADEVPAAKPAGDGLLLCCEQLGASPESSVYVGDSPSDGKAARNVPGLVYQRAGMQSIGVLWGANGKAALEGEFDVLVDDVPALVEALRHLLGDA